MFSFQSLVNFQQFPYLLLIRFILIAPIQYPLRRFETHCKYFFIGFYSYPTSDIFTPAFPISGSLSTFSATANGGKNKKKVTDHSVNFDSGSSQKIDIMILSAAVSVAID
uniref:Uncharacterized protein n=1 Tax=Octopus bimaculoides TaxID=37653 RepID=A0A0L8GB86_OCTBM